MGLEFESEYGKGTKFYFHIENKFNKVINKEYEENIEHV